MNAHEVNWTPWSACTIPPTAGWRFLIAMSSALTTRVESLRVVDRPAHDLPRERIHHGATENLFFPRGMFRDVGNPEFVRGESVELAMQQVSVTVEFCAVLPFEK